MARIRTIKPEFWTDEKLAPLPPITRLVYIALWNMADDKGRLVDSVKMIDGFMFSQTEDSCEEPLTHLARLGRITRGVTMSGQRVIQIVHWNHQKIDKPNHKNTLPEIDETSQLAFVDVSEISRRIIADQSGTNLVPEPSTSTVDRSADADADDAVFSAGPFIDAWREIRQGIPPAGIIAKVCKAVVVEIGMAETLHRWNRFLAERRHSPPAYFSQEHGQYAGLALVNGRAPPEQPQDTWFEPPSDPDEIARLKSHGFR